MKLYCYYASARSHTMAYSQPSYAKSFERTGVSERDIPRGNSLLISVGLLAMYHRPSYMEAEEISLDDDLEGYGANRYYMAGYQSLFAKGKGGRPAADQHGR